ncbi:hypothetical protein V6Z12_A05G113100 [Gossypium hirsutum]
MDFIFVRHFPVPPSSNSSSCCGSSRFRCCFSFPQNMSCQYQKPWPLLLRTIFHLSRNFCLCSLTKGISLSCTWN